MIERHEQNGTIYYVYNDDKKLPTIVMIHGFRGTHHGLDLIARNLDGYRIIVPDLPGFGESQPLKVEHSVDNYVHWLGGFIGNLHLTKPPILLGHSFGSIITSHYASRYPQTISELILVNPIGAPALKGPKAVMTQAALVYYWLGRKLPEKVAFKLLSAKPIVMIMSISMAKTHDRKTRRYVHDQHLAHFSTFANREVVAEAFKASVNHTVREVARDIDLPTLLIVGDQDDITPLNKQKELAKLIKNTQLHIIEKVGHLTHYETPKSVADAIKQFTASSL
ncbi:alpha/beta hydrolase [Candidatus Saccharibacteria bacterium]|nr:alpha/beta hydrolase [Candidatus Saccharibacteria bacterium]